MNHQSEWYQPGFEFTWASGANIVIVHAQENFGNYLQGVSLVSFWEKGTFRRLVLRCSTPNVLVALASCLPQPGFRKLDGGKIWNLAGFVFSPKNWPVCGVQSSNLGFKILMFGIKQTTHNKLSQQEEAGPG